MLNEIIGKTMVDINRKGDEQIIFTCSDGMKYRMYHSQDCCEYVVIEDIVGDLDDLLNTPIIVAEERTSEGSERDDHDTWTFYEFRTMKGSVTIRWHGSSNGYYSESVDFVAMCK